MYELTASSQCLRANLWVLSSVDKPFPTYQQNNEKESIFIGIQQNTKRNFVGEKD